MKLRTLAPWTLAGLALLAGCSASRNGVDTTSRSQGPDAAPAYFTEATDYGYRYAHNWVDRPCFTIDLPGQDWVLQSATADYVTWRKGDYFLKLYLVDNRASAFAVSGMTPEDALRAYVGYELDYIRPKFEKQSSPPPSIRQNETGVWALWRWEGRMGHRAGVGKPQPADQRHLLASLWVDPWVISFDWSTAKLDQPDRDSPELLAAVRSLHFAPQCFQQMRTGETWNQPNGVSGVGGAGSNGLAPAGTDAGDPESPTQIR